MPRVNNHIDSTLRPEARMERMREEMYRLRRTIIEFISDPYKAVIEYPYSITKDESRNWLYKTTDRIIELTEPDEQGRAICPLCKGVPQFVGVGYTYPIGLERHLRGSHNASQCDVMYAADGLRRIHHRHQWPGDLGPYGCD